MDQSLRLASTTSRWASSIMGSSSPLPRNRATRLPFRSFGPPMKMRISPEQLDRELGSIGLKRRLLDTETLPYQYIAIYNR